MPLSKSRRDPPEALLLVLFFKMAKRRFDQIATRYDPNQAHRFPVSNHGQTFEAMYGQPRRDEPAGFVGQCKSGGPLLQHVSQAQMALRS